MKTQWPVPSTPFPLGQMQAPISTSPSMHGGDTTHEPSGASA
jgi:hypothetical protein